MRKFEGRVRTYGTRILGAAAVAALATLGACGGGEGTTGTSGSVLDANAIGAAANQLQAISAQPVIAAIAGQASVSSIAGFDRMAPLPRLVPQSMVNATQLVPGARIGASLRAAIGTPRVANGTVASSIPDSLLGKTLVPDGSGQYTVSAGATGAPANGVRFIIRPLGSVQDLGYADLTQGTDGASATLTLDVTPANGSVVLHDVETATGSAPDSTVSHAGYATNGTDRIDYTEIEHTVNARTTAVTTLTAPSAGVAIADSSVIDGMTANDVDVARMTIGATTLRFTNGAVADASGGTYSSSDTTNVSANGVPFARIVVANGQAQVTGPNGQALSSGDQAALFAAEGVLVSAAMVLIAPVLIGLWLALASGAF